MDTAGEFEKPTQREAGIHSGTGATYGELVTPSLIKSVGYQSWYLANPWFLQALNSLQGLGFEKRLHLHVKQTVEEFNSAVSEHCNHEPSCQGSSP